MRIHAHRQVSGQTPPRDMQRCPSCGTDGALSMLASRAASLSSVAVGHLYTTPFNADKKLLAFSDSVQDASHRAGFFSGRTYRFSVRTALLAAVPERGSIPLTELPERMWSLWSERMRREGKGDEDMIAAFMPRDLDYLAEYQAYIEKVRAHRKEPDRHEAPSVPEPLREKLMRRLSWEVTRELGLAARIGRTLERVGSASVQVDPERFDRAVRAMRDRLPNRIGALRDVDPRRFRIFAAGLITRVRLRGGALRRAAEALLPAGQPEAPLEALRQRADSALRSLHLAADLPHRSPGAQALRHRPPEADQLVHRLGEPRVRRTALAARRA